MSDIINADNAPAIIAAVLSGLAGLAVWRQGGRLGDEAKHLQPPGTPTTPAVAITNEGAKSISTPLWKIAHVLEEYWEDTKRRRESEDLLERLRREMNRDDDH